MSLPAKPPLSWREPDDRYGWMACLRVVGLLIALLAAAPWLALYVSPWTLALLAPMIGILAHKMTIVVHDCSHMALFRSKNLNQWVGRLSAAMIGADFEEFTRVHWLHHRHLAQQVDPQHEDYVGLPGRTLPQVIWHLCKPLLGASYYKLILFALGRRIISSAEQSDATGLAERARPRDAGLSSFQRLALIGGVQLAIAALASGGFAVWWLVFFYPLAAGTFGLFFSRIRSYVEHVAPHPSSPAAYVRTHLPNRIDSLLIFELNFNYHVEHHLFPWVASHRLPQLHKLVASAGFHTPSTLSSGVLKTLTRPFESSNRGAAAPAVPEFHHLIAGKSSMEEEFEAGSR